MTRAEGGTAAVAPNDRVVLAGSDSLVVGRMLDHGMCELRYATPDGTVIRTAEYARCGHELVSQIGPAGAPAQQRWASFASPRPVEVRIRGTWYRGTGAVVNRDAPGWTGAREVYRGQNPRARVNETAAFLVITLRPETPAG